MPHATLPTQTNHKLHIHPKIRTNQASGAERTLPVTKQYNKYHKHLPGSRIDPRILGGWAGKFVTRTRSAAFDLHVVEAFSNCLRKVDQPLRSFRSLSLSLSLSLLSAVLGSRGSCLVCLNIVFGSSALVPPCLMSLHLLR